MNRQVPYCVCLGSSRDCHTDHWHCCCWKYSIGIHLQGQWRYDKGTKLPASLQHLHLPGQLDRFHDQLLPRYGSQLVSFQSGNHMPSSGQAIYDQDCDCLSITMPLSRQPSTFTKKEHIFLSAWLYRCKWCRPVTTEIAFRSLLPLRLSGERHVMVLCPCNTWPLTRQWTRCASPNHWWTHDRFHGFLSSMIPLVSTHDNAVD